MLNIIKGIFICIKEMSMPVKLSIIIGAVVLLLALILTNQFFDFVEIFRSVE